MSALSIVKRAARTIAAVPWLPDPRVNQCILCQRQISQRPAPGYSALCAACTGELPRITQACLHCGLPLAQSALQCGSCQGQEFLVDRCFCLYRYAHPLDFLIREFKHNNSLPAAKLLMALTNNEAQHLPWQEWDALIAVPLHWRKLWQRGFNQSQVLAVPLARRYNLELITIHRNKHTLAQQGLNRKQRLKNLNKAFVAPTAVIGKRVLIIDDVITTGTTINAIAKELLSTGASSVDALGIARTPSP